MALALTKQKSNMAKVTEQDIPSELLQYYQRSCQPSTTSRVVDYVKSRYPWRVPPMQNGGRGVSVGQRIQRDRFLYVLGKYHLLSEEAKERWRQSVAERGGYLFWYNFFVLEGLMGGGPPEYPVMIKSIQIVKESVPVTGGKVFTISEVDPAKCVVMLQGASQKWLKIQRGASTIIDGGTNNHGLSPNVLPAVCEVLIQGQGGKMEISGGDGEGDWASPYAFALTASQLTVKMIATGMTMTAGYSWQVIEHKEQAIFPVLVAIAAEAVTVDWAIVPDIAAEVTITVVEYL